MAPEPFGPVPEAESPVRHPQLEAGALVRRGHAAALAEGVARGPPWRGGGRGWGASRIPPGGRASPRVPPPRPAGAPASAPPAPDRRESGAAIHQANPADHDAGAIFAADTAPMEHAPTT